MFTQRWNNINEYSSKSKVQYSIKKIEYEKIYGSFENIHEIKLEFELVLKTLYTIATFKFRCMLHFQYQYKLEIHDEFESLLLCD